MPATPKSFLFTSLLLLSPPLSHSFFITSYYTLYSLSHSVISRVAALRAARGDVEGAARTRALARSLERWLGPGLYKYAWNVGWDFVKNGPTSFRDLGGAVSHFKELLGALSEFSKLRSDAERAAWLGRNYNNALRVSKSLFHRLLQVFHQPGALRDIVVSFEKEVVEGDLLRDCIELGAGDLKGFIQIVKDIFPQYFPAAAKSEL